MLNLSLQPCQSFGTYVSFSLWLRMILEHQHDEKQICVADQLTSKQGNIYQRYQTVRKKPRTSIRKLYKFFRNLWEFIRSSTEESWFALVRVCKAFPILDLNVGLSCLSINSVASFCDRRKLPQKSLV